MYRIALAMLLVVATNAQAETQISERVLKDTMTMVQLHLDSSSVFCTDRGYGNIQLKVSVPDLDVLAHFDHRVVGERLPCITGGQCLDPNEPGTILDPHNADVLVPIRVKLSEQYEIDRVPGTCVVVLREDISSVIRGRHFTHTRFGSPEIRNLVKCDALIGL